MMQRTLFLALCLTCTHHGRRILETGHDEHPRIQDIALQQSRAHHPVKALAGHLLSGVAPRTGWQTVAHSGVTNLAREPVSRRFSQQSAAMLGDASDKGGKHRSRNGNDGGDDEWDIREVTAEVSDVMKDLKDALHGSDEFGITEAIKDALQKANPEAEIVMVQGNKANPEDEQFGAVEAIKEALAKANPEATIVTVDKDRGKPAGPLDKLLDKIGLGRKGRADDNSEHQSGVMDSVRLEKHDNGKKGRHGRGLGLDVDELKNLIEGKISSGKDSGMVVVQVNHEDEDDEDESLEGSRDKGAATVESIQSFDLRPKEIVDYLNRYVIRQDDAKKVLAVAICDHYNHVRRYLNSPDVKQPINYAKPNILLAGPTGVGKTYLMKSIARQIGVPFVKGDATKFSETGIVGKDAEDLVRDLVDAAGGNTSVAQFGIIYIDEVDKIASGGGSGPNRHGDFNKRGVQNNFLKLLEDTDVPLESPTGFPRLGGLFGPSGPARPTSINTRNILFIFSGAFTNLDSEIKRKKEHKSFGFRADGTSTTDDAKSSANKSYLRYAETSDFVSAGLEPEFVGRVPVRVALDALTAEDLKDILTKAEGSVLGQFVRDFEGYSINMTANDAALVEVAKLAEKEGTGARGLVTVLERTLREHKYELPSSSIKSFELDNATVLDPTTALESLLKTQSLEDEFRVRKEDLKRYEKRLNKQIAPFRMPLKDDAIDYIVDLSRETGESAYSIATHRFEKLPETARRLQELDKNLFTMPIDLEVAQDPEEKQKEWIHGFESALSAKSR